MKNKMDWAQFENIPFAVVMHSSEMGWIVFSRPEPENCWSRYDACDCRKKMLLNYGLIIAQTDEAKELLAA